MKNNPFLLCSNPVSKEKTPDEYILHTRKPRFLAKATPISFDEITEDCSLPFVDMLYLNPDGEMEIIHIEIIDRIDRTDDEEFTLSLFQAHDWYFNVIREYDKMDKLNPSVLLKDFSPELPGLKILQAPNRWAVVYHGLVAEFDNEEAMDEFLERDLEIASSLLDKGIINHFA